MSDPFETRRFPSSAEFLAFLRETSDDMKSVTIPVQPAIEIVGPQGDKKRAKNVGAVIELCSGKSVFLHREDAEMLLNDGVLARMKVPCVLSTLDRS